MLTRSRSPPIASRVRFLNDEANIKALNADFATFQSDAGALPSYQPPNAPTQQQVGTAITLANNAIASARATSNGDIDKGNADVVSAYQSAAQAYRAGGCGQPTSAPSPQPYI
jgi:hypothetical protein